MPRINYVIAIGLLASSVQALSAVLPYGELVIQGGASFSKPGTAQHINIHTLVGDQYTLSNSTQSKGLFGLSYLVSGPTLGRALMSYGISGFYLPKVGVRGDIIQENIFANLGYSYGIRNLPLYATAKSVLMHPSDRIGLTIDTGIGANFNKTTTVDSWAINDSNAVADRVFSGRSNTVFSAMAGVGFRINHGLANIPLDCGYRYFYLGKGSFNKRSNEWLNTLSTGDNHAQAIICSLTV